MASPRAPPDEGDAQQPDPVEENAEGLRPTKGKEKKRVGFASDNEPQATNSGSPFHLTPDEGQAAAHDSFSYSASSYGDGYTPLQHAGPATRGSFNSDELAAALAQILDSEEHSDPPAPTRPRPVLRKSAAALPSSTDTPMAAHRSEVEAKHRADLLAYSVGTSSIPVSSRGSVASDAGTAVDRDSPLDSSTATVARDFAPSTDMDALRPRRKAQMEADQLVRSHTRRKSPLIQSSLPPRSGTSTPVEHDLEYIPPPQKYKGGILGTLLKLYGSEDKHGLLHSDSSGPNTPASTPPTSRSSTPKPDSHRRPWRSQSSGTLAGIMESSFMFAAPASSKDISEAVSEKLKQERGRPKKPAKSKKKDDEFRIKIHIADIINRHTYLLKLCKVLMTYGAPTHRLEAYMTMSARVLGIEAQFMYLPDTMIISFDDSNTHTTEVKMVRAGQALDFGRLRDVHEIYKEVVHDRIGVEEATARLKEVTARKPKFPVWLRILLYGFASATVAPFGFEGRYIDMPICFILGCCVGFLQLYLAPSNDLYANVFEITAAVATSFLARLFGSVRGGELFCFSSLAQASIALILPGYTVLCASLELQSHQMMSGSVRMVYALIYTLFLGYGFTIGSVLYGYMNKDAVSTVHCSVGESWFLKRPPEDSYLLFVLPFTLCLCFINQAKWKQTPVQLFISLAGYCVNDFSSRFFKGNGIISSSLGALTIGVLANLYSRLGRYTENRLLDLWERHAEPRLRRLPYADSRTADSGDSIAAKEQPDLEVGTLPSGRRAPKVGYGLAAAAMLPAIFVQVPSGLAASGSLLSGVTSADQITHNDASAGLNNSAFNVLFSVIQVAINISVGLSLSALLVYPFGKRRSGLFSF